MNMGRNCFWLIIAALSIVSLALAGNTGKIAGKITDAATGEPLPSANIVVEGTSMGASTDLDGNYVILNVPPGLYNLTISYIGYKKTQVRDVRVNVDFTTNINTALQQGEIELETIIVQGERTPLIRKDLTNPVASISEESLTELPVTEISEVIGLQAGVTVDNDGALHIRGGYSNEVSYTVNGVNVNNPYGNTRSVGLATNAVQEVSVSVGTFSAEYGQALSGVVNYVTKEGGSRFNGGIRFLTGDHLSSRTDLFPYIDDFQINNVYRLEGSVGGPILTNKLGFYASGVYNYFGGTLYGQRLYRIEDSYLSRESFPSTDPRRGSASDPYYFAPYSRPVTDLVGGPTGDSAVIPLNWNWAYNLQGNLVFRFTPEMKIKYEAIYDRSEGPSGAGNSGSLVTRYKPDGRRLAKGQGLYQTIDWTHVLSERAFYTLKFSQVDDWSTSRTFESLEDPRYLPSFYLQSLANTGFLTGGVDLTRFEQKTLTRLGKFDMTAQLMKIHEVKVGLEYRWNDVTAESYVVQFKDPNYPNIDPNPTNYLSGLYTFLPTKPTIEGGYVKYTRNPIQAAAYFQDKIELFQSIVLNLGLRYDYFDPAADYNPYISEEISLQDTIFITENLQPASKKHILQPRISFSFPITDQGIIRFSYGHFAQIGSLASLYSNPEFRAPLGTSPSFGNPNVEPQTSTQYEVGLSQALMENLRLEVTGYYKDVRDYIYNQTIITARGDRSYSVLTNLSYANIRGVTISLFKPRRMGELVSATLDYTFQVAEANRTEPTDEIFYNEQKGKLSETFLVPLDFDRGHTLTGSLTISESANWLISVLGYFRTGTPYTPAFPSSVVPITFEQNSDQQMIQWNVDLRMEKYFRVAPVDLSVYLQVDNLFDTQNELSVYSNSGRALYNIEEVVNPYEFNELRGRIARGDVGMIPMSAVDNYYANPANVSTPRLVRFGLSVLF